MTTQVLIGKVIGVLKSINFRQLMSLVNRFKFSITVVPEGTSYVSAKTYPFWKVALFLYIFGTVCALITGILMVYTPMNKLFFNQSYQLSHYQVEEFRKLDQQLNYLVREVERLRENNKRLEDAIMLGDSTALEPFLKKGPGARKQPGAGGNFLDALEWFRSYTPEQPAAGDNRCIEFRRPCDGIISNHFHASDGHFGVDFALNVGSPVFSVLNGYVIFADHTADDGYMIIVAHTDGYVSVYKHCMQVLRKARHRVQQGEIIALSGATGRLSHGPHLHFELWKDGSVVDPEKYLLDK